MNSQTLRNRWNRLRARLEASFRPLPHGCDPLADIDRRLTRTAIEVIFDVGANRGETAKRFRQWFPKATIHCFEPVPSTFDALRRAVSSSGSTELHQIGFSRAAGAAEIFVTVDDTRSSLSTSSLHDRGSISIQLETLDRFCDQRDISRIDYLKVDTEGHDLAVLEGGSGLLSTAQIAIVEVEAGMNPDNQFHVPLSALTGFLESYHYRLFGVYEQTLEWTRADAYLRRSNLVFVSPHTVRLNHWSD